MSSALRFAVALAIALGLVAWAGSIIVDQTARRR
jgi:hypothetical protein